MPSQEPLKGFMVRKQRVVDEGREPKIYPTREEAGERVGELAKEGFDAEVEEVIARRPNMHSVFFKTVVNVRLDLIKAPSQADAIKMLDDNFGQIAGLFKQDRPMKQILTKDGQVAEVKYTEWAEEHKCVLVDEENGELDDFEGSEWYEETATSWEPMRDGDWMVKADSVQPLIDEVMAVKKLRDDDANDEEFFNALAMMIDAAEKLEKLIKRR